MNHLLVKTDKLGTQESRCWEQFAPGGGKVFLDEATLKEQFKSDRLNLFNKESGSLTCFGGKWSFTLEEAGGKADGRERTRSECPAGNLSEFR